jgi:hypothetical protein
MLPNNNYTNRVLPIRIHDLDIADIKLCESLFGGVIRGIDFVYKSAGVNRPLRSKEDNPQDNLNHTIYRDQINKVALSIKDIIESMKAPVFAGQMEDEEFGIYKIEEKTDLHIEELNQKERINTDQKYKISHINPDIEEKSQPWQLQNLLYIFFIILGIFVTLFLLF